MNKIILLLFFLFSLTLFSYDSQARPPYDDPWWCDHLDEIPPGKPLPDCSPQTPPPNMPEFIIYTPYSTTGSFKVRWGASSSPDVTYFLQRRVNNGGWMQIYSGTALSHNLSNLPDNLYQFRVHACKSNKCSRFVQLKNMAVKRRATNSFKTLSQLTKANVTLLAEEPKPSTEICEPMLMNSATASGCNGDSKPNVDYSLIGNGYDVLSDMVSANHCWAQSDDALLVGNKLEAYDGKQYLFTIATTRSELASQLDLGSSLSADGAYGGFSASYNNTTKLYQAVNKVEESSVIVGMMELTAYKANIVNKTKRQLQSNYIESLAKKSINQQKEFRKSCGDDYVNEIILGRQTYVTIKVNKAKSTKEERIETTSRLRGDLNLFKADMSESNRTQLLKRYANYGFEIQAVSKGSSVGVTSIGGLNDLTRYMQNFENNQNQTFIPIKISHQSYEIPFELSDNAHFDIFMDYRSVKDKLVSWESFDKQITSRCELFHVDAEIKDNAKDAIARAFSFEAQKKVGVFPFDSCNAIKAMLKIQVEKCINHESWDSCYVPLDSNCQDSVNNTGQCMTLPNKLPLWEAEEYSSKLYSRKDSYCTPFFTCVDEDSAEICLSSAESIRDMSVGSGTTKGASIVVHADWGDTSSSHTLTNNNRCLTSYAKTRKHGTGGGAKYESSQYLYGFAPWFLGYVF